MTVESASTPALATIKGVELGSVGYWDISNIQGWHPTAENLASAVAALDCPGVRRPALKFGHSGEQGVGDPSIGLIDDLRLSDDGQTLLGDFVGVPAWLADADAEGRSVIASAYPDRSGEWEHNYVCQLGHTHPFVLHAMALLGVIRPGIGTLESLYDLYVNAPEKEVVVANAAIALSGTTIDQIRTAYYDGPGQDWHLWIREMFVDPAELIVQNDDTNTLTRVPYTVSGDGDVEFGDGQAVKVEYVAAMATVRKPELAYASRAEARTPQNPSAAQAEDTLGKEGAMPTLKEGLAEQLGIPADADDATALQALTEALAERAETTVVLNEDGGSLTLEQVAAAARQLGQTMLDEATATRLVADSAAGREALGRIQRQADEQVVSSAISDGKIFASRREHYMKLMEMDRDGTTSALSSMPKEAAVPLSEIGHGTEAVDENTTTIAKNWSF